MTQKLDGGPAYPARDFWSDDGRRHFHGMTLRDWFAGQALAMMDFNRQPTEHELRYDFPGEGEVDMMQVLAKRAYSFADAMIAERDK